MPLSRLVALAILLALPAAQAQKRKKPKPSDALRTGEHEVVLGGVRFWYRVAGTGKKDRPPLVFLHGGPGYNSYSFAALEGRRLERSLRVVYYDQRGAGRSERPWTGHYALDTLVEDVESLRRILSVPKIALMGHSFGGMLALEYAARYPARVSKLVLAGALADGPATCATHLERLKRLHPTEYARVAADTAWQKASPRACIDWESRALGGAGFEAFNTQGIFPDSMVRKRMDSVDAASGLRNTGEQQRALFRAGLLDHRFTGQAQLTMPTLVIIGRQDYAIGTMPQRMLAAALPKVRVVEYERAGHFMYLDEPRRFTHDVVSFLNQR
jgi:proline iminopeptidase